MDEQAEPQHSAEGRRDSKTERLNLRLTSPQYALLAKAAEIHGEGVRGFVVRHALLAAESDLADHTVFFANDEQFEAVQTILSAPPPVPDKLAELLERPSRLTSREV
jgi:uncharacterized protein (DUF1778 family)